MGPVFDLNAVADSNAAPMMFLCSFSPCQALNRYLRVMIKPQTLTGLLLLITCRAGGKGGVKDAFSSCLLYLLLCTT